MSNKVWNVSVVTTFDPKTPGQHYLAIDDLGTVGTRDKALSLAKKHMKNFDHEKIYDTEEEVIFKFGKQELHVELIYGSE